MLNKYALFFTAIVLMWLKTYIVYQLSFELPIENLMQEFILFINPLSSAVLLLVLALFFSGKAQKRSFLILHFIGSFVLYANVVYYRSFDDFITIPVLFQTQNFGDLGGSALALIKYYDILYFLDFIVLALLMKYMNFEFRNAKKKTITTMLAFAAALLFVNVSLANIERPQLLTRTFDREKLVKFLGTYNYHVYDVLLHAKSNAQKAFADSSDLVEIRNYVNANHVDPNEKFFGTAKGKNVIFISMESLQNFVINYKLHGKEATPFLNSLVDSDFFYFDNFYHQTGQGKTSDSEFLIENSLYPLSRGAVFVTNSQNEYNALPEILDERNYYSAAFHGNNASFWNRDIMYKTLGYDKYFSEKYFTVTEKNKVNYGIKDIPFFKQSLDYLEDLPQPFNVKYITLTHHFPFNLDDPKDAYIQPAKTDDPTVNKYFQTARYMDEALKRFINDLKEKGIFQNSVIIMYGDHYGISTNHNKAMSKILDKEITPYETVQLQKVPLFIHIPGMEGKTVDTISGQIDIKPTLMHLLGIDTKAQIMFGNDLFSKERPEFAVLRDSSFITKDHVFTEETCYEKPSGEKVKISLCKPYINKAKTELTYSDKIVYGDLLRFLDDVKGKENDFK